MATTIAVAAVPLLGATGLAIDYSIMVQKRYALQDAADAAALAGAKELAIASTKDSTVFELAKQYVYSNLGTGPDDKLLAIAPKVSSDRSTLTVDVSYAWSPFMIQFMDRRATPIIVSSSASLAGNENLCVVALNQTASQTLALTGKSSITASDCAVYSNSHDPQGMSIVSGSTLQASSTYSSGGFHGPGSGYKPEPVTDSPVITDPLGDRTAPSVGHCDNTNLTINNGFVTLFPGVYCGGITVGGKAEVNLRPGEYIIKDGPMTLSGNATLKGDYVGFYFDGTNATFDFGVSTQISISAPRTGLLSGLLFFESRSAPANREFVIRSKDAERFEGTVYLPNGKLVVDKASRVGQLSDWTAIVANQIEIRTGPQLVINSDYGASDIPVPEGIGPMGTVPRLTN